MLSVRIPHHCRAKCLVHQCTAAPPKTAQTPKWAVFSGTQLCLAADAFASSCKFFQRTIPITLSSPILKEISAHKSRIKVFLGLWGTIHSSHAVAAEAQGSSSLAPIANGWVCACYSISPSILCKRLLFWASEQHSDCKGQKSRIRSINCMFQSTAIIMLCTDICSSFNEMRVKAPRPEGVETFKSQTYASCIPTQHKAKINH